MAAARAQASALTPLIVSGSIVEVEGPKPGLLRRQLALLPAAVIRLLAKQRGILSSALQHAAWIAGRGLAQQHLLRALRSWAPTLRRVGASRYFGYQSPYSELGAIESMDGIIDAPTTDWWAVQVRAGREQLAARHLRVRGYEIFVPCYLEHRRWSDRIKKVERPLFAGYLFCRVPRATVGKVVTTPSVIRVLGDSRGPLPVPQGEIEAVRRITETRLAVSPWPFVDVGQKVRVEVGPLRDLEGIVLATKSGRRLVVSIPLLNRSAAVELNADWISVPLRKVVGDASPEHSERSAGGPPAPWTAALLHDGALPVVGRPGTGE